MVKKILLLALIATPLGLIGCKKSGGSSSNAGSLSCAWFLDTNNCWQTTLDAANTCLSDLSATSGTLAAGGASCTNTGSGGSTTVTFTNPVNEAAPVDTDPWNFSVDAGSGQCLSFTETASGQSVVTSAGTFTAATSGSSYTVSCPDGNSYSMSVSAALGCDWSYLPGFGSSSGGAGSFSFSLLGDPGTTTSFSCN